MTSQLILLNGFGVALASDSAMTLGNKRTYETAEKVIPIPHQRMGDHSRKHLAANSFALSTELFILVER